MKVYQLIKTYVDEYATYNCRCGIITRDKVIGIFSSKEAAEKRMNEMGLSYEMQSERDFPYASIKEYEVLDE